MGGSALKNVETRRMDRAEYETVKACVLKRLKEHVRHARVVRELPGKESFGDLDVLVVPDLPVDTPTKAARKAVRGMVQRVFSPNEVVSNGTVHSFDFEQSQIDLIVCEDRRALDMAAFYFAYSDVGGLLGRILAAHGLKYGHCGLWLDLLHCTVYPGAPVDMTHRLGRIMLTDSPRTICKFLGMNHEAFERGFRSQAELVAWIKSCRFFHPSLFATLNHRHRHRAKTRPFYMAFIDSLRLEDDDELGLPRDTGKNAGHESGREEARQGQQGHEQGHEGQETKGLPHCADRGGVDAAVEEKEDVHGKRGRASGKPLLQKCVSARTSELVVNRQQEALEYFGKEADVQAIVDARRRRAEFKAKFSGRLFAEQGLKKQAIGRAIAAFQQYVMTKLQLTESDEKQAQKKQEKAFENYVLRSSADEIAREVAAFCSTA